MLQRGFSEEFPLPQNETIVYLRFRLRIPRIQGLEESQEDIYLKGPNKIFLDTALTGRELEVITPDFTTRKTEQIWGDRRTERVTTLITPPREEAAEVTYS